MPLQIIPAPIEIRLPTTLRNKCERIAEDAGMSLQTFIFTAVIERMKRLRAKPQVRKKTSAR